MDDPDYLQNVAFATTDVAVVTVRTWLACTWSAWAGLLFGLAVTRAGWWVPAFAVAALVAVLILIRATAAILRLAEAVVLARRQAER